MKKDDKLIKEARESAEFRGHRLGAFRNLKSNGIKAAQCGDCGKCVFVNLSPLPNEIEISGEAIALFCVGRR